MNNVIVYFRNLEIYLYYFNKILRFLKKFEMTFVLKECYFKYSNIKVLKHYIFKLNFNILKKMKTIKNFRFSRIFKKLKITLNFFEYYQKFVT